MKIDFTKRALKQLLKLTKDVQNRIREVLLKTQELETIDEIKSEKLKGHERFKIRIGNYRIIYRVVDEKHIEITAVAHRKGVYRVIFTITL